MFIYNWKPVTRKVFCQNFRFFQGLITKDRGTTNTMLSFTSYYIYSALLLLFVHMIFTLGSASLSSYPKLGKTHMNSGGLDHFLQHSRILKWQSLCSEKLPEHSASPKSMLSKGKAAAYSMLEGSLGDMLPWPQKPLVPPRAHRRCEGVSPLETPHEELEEIRSSFWSHPTPVWDWKLISSENDHPLPQILTTPLPHPAHTHIHQPQHLHWGRK